MMTKHTSVMTVAALILAFSANPSLAQQRKATASQRCKDGSVVTVTGGSGTCLSSKSGVSCTGIGGSGSGSCSGGTATCNSSSGGGSCTVTKAIVRSNLGANGTGAQIRNSPTTTKADTSTTSNTLVTTKSTTLTEQHVNTLGTTQVHTQR